MWKQTVDYPRFQGILNAWLRVPWGSFSIVYINLPILTIWFSDIRDDYGVEGNQDDLQSEFLFVLFLRLHRNAARVWLDNKPYMVWRASPEYMTTKQFRKSSWISRLKFQSLTNVRKSQKFFLKNRTKCLIYANNCKYCGWGYAIKHLFHWIVSR